MQARRKEWNMNIKMVNKRLNIKLHLDFVVATARHKYDNDDVRSGFEVFCVPSQQIDCGGIKVFCTFRIRQHFSKNVSSAAVDAEREFNNKLTM